jgi:hypothetical protein
MEGGREIEDVTTDEQIIEARSIEEIVTPALNKLAVTDQEPSELLRLTSSENFFNTHQTQGAINELAIKILASLRGV